MREIFIQQLEEMIHSFPIEDALLREHIFADDMVPLEAEGEIKLTPQLLFGKRLAIESRRKDLGEP